MSTTMPPLEERRQEKARVEEHLVSSERLVTRVRELLHEGTVRRVIVKNQEGVVLMEIPLTVGVVSAVLLPVWVALGAIAALAAHYRIAVEKVPPRRAADPGYVFHSRPDV